MGWQALTNHPTKKKRGGGDCDNQRQLCNEVLATLLELFQDQGRSNGGKPIRSGAAILIAGCFEKRRKNFFNKTYIYHKYKLILYGIVFKLKLEAHFSVHILIHFSG